MKKHKIKIDNTQYPGTINCSKIFNVAVHMIDRHIKEGRANKTVIQCVDGTTVSYQELQQRVNQCGNYLAALGYVKGDRILLVIKDSPEFFYLFWGAIKVGIIPVPVNTILRCKDYSYFIENLQCSGLFYSAMYSAETLPAVEMVNHKPANVIAVDDINKSLLAVISQYSQQLDACPTDQHDDCFILFSSGTTGKPKGAVHSHRNLVVTCLRFAEQTLKYTEADVIYSAAKLFFAYGLGGANNFVLWAGATVILDPQRPTAETVMKLLHEYRPSIFLGVPTLYAKILQINACQSLSVNFLKLCCSAGEALPTELYEQWNNITGLKLLDGIGSTENLSHFLCNTIGNEKPGSSGTEIPGYQAKIIDDAGNEVAFDAVGQLVVKGESMANRYWKNPEKTAQTMVDGWLYTGDSYSKDKHGFFYCHGRNDDMLKVGGIWCSPLEIEAKLFEHCQVLEAAVVGAADEDGLIKPKAFIVTKSIVADINQFTDELRTLCKRDLAPYKYPRWFEIIDEMPRTATGKIQRFQLR